MSSSESNPNTSQRRRTPTVNIVVLATTTALVLLVTTFASTPIPGVPGQRFNAGDIMVFIASFTFGPTVGGFAGGVGSSLSDALLPGGQYFAPFTLIIKGTEGYLVGHIAQRNFRRKEQAAWLVGGLVVVGGYFVAEAFLLGAVFGTSIAPGLGYAIGEFPFNILQAVGAGVVGIPVSRYLRRSLLSTFLTGSPKTEKPSAEKVV